MVRQSVCAFRPPLHRARWKCQRGPITEWRYSDYRTTDLTRCVVDVRPKQQQHQWECKIRYNGMS